MDQKILEKLNKLLALSASDNENEASLAMKKAEELMREHNLSVADVAMDGSNAAVDSMEVDGLTKTSQKWELFLGLHIANAFHGRTIKTRHDNGWRLIFVAGKTDLVLIVDLYERLRATIKRMSSAYVASAHHGPARSLHHSYRLGMVTTIGQRLARFRDNSVTSDRNTFGLTGKDLVLVKDQAVATEVSRLFPRLHQLRHAPATVDGAAYRQGLSDGNVVNLHRPLDG